MRAPNFAHLARRFRRGARRQKSPISATQPPRHRRLANDLTNQRTAFLQAATDYVENLGAGGQIFLYLKPFDRSPGHEVFFTEIYQVLNMIRAMALPAGARVVEVGSGPGWITEMLVMLGYQVDAVEPSADMIRVARERVTACIEQHRLEQPPRVTFHCQPFEDCQLADDSFDGILFHESLHHVIDEDRVLALALRKLCPGGVLGVSGDEVWQPGNATQAEFYRQETARYGTLESPFTREYLDHLLAKHGFDRVVRYHGVNGLFPVEQGRRTLAAAAQFPGWAFNLVTARKPGGPRSDRTTANSAGGVAGEIELIDSVCDVSRGEIHVRARLRNIGQTAWLHEAPAIGDVTLALRLGEPHTAEMREAPPRGRLPRAVDPGETLVVEHTFRMPADAPAGDWQLELVHEHVAWFSRYGTRPAMVRWPAAKGLSGAVQLPQKLRVRRQRR